MDFDAHLALAVIGDVQGNARGLSRDNLLGSSHEGMSREKCQGLYNKHTHVYTTETARQLLTGFTINSA